MTLYVLLPICSTTNGEFKGENTFQPKIDSKQDTECINPFVGLHLQTQDLHLTEQTNTTEKLKFLTFFNRSKKVSTFLRLFLRPLFLCTKYNCIMMIQSYNTHTHRKIWQHNLNQGKLKY